MMNGAIAMSKETWAVILIGTLILSLGAIAIAFFTAKRERITINAEDEQLGIGA